MNEYLRLSKTADRQQIVRIKSVFEKQNKALAHNEGLYRTCTSANSVSIDYISGYSTVNYIKKIYYVEVCYIYQDFMRNYSATSTDYLVRF